MSPHDLSFLGMYVFGGLALFILGMRMMTEGLTSAAGNHLRPLLARATKNRISGITLGTILGFLMHSGATTVMLVGFINAGLVTLIQAIPPILGANVGTTLSMQLVSLNLGDYCYLPIVIGLVLYMAGSQRTYHSAGQAFLGLGLIFLGMKVMSDAVIPHRDLLVPWLTLGDPGSLRHMLLGVGISIVVTTILQSSGATIGICFALATAGVFTRIEQVYPLILGAHIGTCTTALIGSVGAHVEARRAALTHLVFNVLATIFAILAAPLFLWLIPRTASDLVHQIANTHTLVLLMAATLMLPCTSMLAKLVSLLLTSREPPAESSYLDKQLLESPERAIYAAIKELQRVARLCIRSFHLVAAIIFQLDPRKVRTIKRNEDAVDEIKRAMKDYLAAMTTRYLSRRQSILITHLDRCMTDIERIGDHIDAICDLSINRQRTPAARFAREAVDGLTALFEAADKVLQLVIQSLDPEQRDFHAMARAILQSRDEYVEKSLSFKSLVTEKTANHEYPPMVAIYLSEYAAGFDRIVRHAKMIALVESHPYFWIKREKLERVAPEAPDYPPPPPEDPRDFLDKLQSEDFV